MERSTFVKAMAGLALPAAMLLVWAGCSKTEQPQPTDPSGTVAEGTMKTQGDPFIFITTGPTVPFHICSPYQQIVCNNPGPSIPYICNSPCLGPQISIKTGVLPDVFCFEPNVIYTIKADVGPPNRQTLKIKFPTGFNECTLTPATRFNYNSTTGTWSLGSPSNGVIWAQGNSSCP